MTKLTVVRERHISLMRRSLQTLGNLVQLISQEEATSWRDGGDGWTVVEVMAHLRDFDNIFFERAKRMVAEDFPALAAWDHDAMAIERRYNDDQLLDVWAALQKSRTEMAEFYEGLTDAQWESAGDHPERESFNMTDAVMQVGLHDNTHIEQITRIMVEKHA